MTSLPYLLDWALCLYITENNYAYIKLNLHCVNHNAAGHNESPAELILYFFFILWSGDFKKPVCLFSLVCIYFLSLISERSMNNTQLRIKFQNINGCKGRTMQPTYLYPDHGDEEPKVVGTFNLQC